MDQRERERERERNAQYMLQLLVTLSIQTSMQFRHATLASSPACSSTSLIQLIQFPMQHTLSLFELRLQHLANLIHPQLALGRGVSLNGMHVEI